MIIRDVSISRLKNYENNPRNNDLAVEKVKYSIDRLGFLFPIIIDINYVIVAGHTRVRACQELGIQTVPCIMADELTEEQINLFRLVDNKTSEYSDWDFEKLKSELAQIDFTIDKNQILLEQFELSNEVFDIEPEQAEIKVPSLNFMNTGTASPKNSRPSVSTIHSSNCSSSSENKAELNDETEAFDGVHNALEDEGELTVSDETPRESKPLLPIYQFRFGDVAFYISKMELDCLNAKYKEYIDTNEVLSHSFVEYLLQGVEERD